MGVVRYRQEFTFAAEAEPLWNLLADTDRLNRALGLPPTTADPGSSPGVRRAVVRAALGPIRLEWIEEPFEFVRPLRYHVSRRFTSRPSLTFVGGASFAPSDSDRGPATRVDVWADIGYVSPAGRAMASALVAKAKADWTRVGRSVEASIEKRGEPRYGPGVDMASPAVEAAVRRAAAERAGHIAEEPLGRELINHLATADDVELSRIRPFRLARLWNADRYDALSLCLRATPAGLLDLSWDILCPNCLGAPERWPDLDRARNESHCDDCQIEFDVNFDRAVEVTFRPHPAVRRLDERIFCSGGPGNSPHLSAQFVLPAGSERRFSLPLRAGRYRLRNLTACSVHQVFVERGEGESSAVWDSADVGSGGGSLWREGDIEVLIRNSSESEQQVVLERQFNYEDVATAAQVTLLQEFRDSFGAQLLAPEARMGIRTLPLLFTDLKGSTALYESLGDAAAYVLVRDHFRLLRDLVAAHHGGVVKTIGDSIMAAYPTSGDALRSALAMSEAIMDVSQETPLRLKIGLHQGACIAVRSYDDRIDYFGGTVNLAARTHEQARGGEVVVTSAIVEDPDLSNLLAGLNVESFRAELRGIGETRLYRLTSQTPPGVRTL